MIHRLSIACYNPTPDANVGHLGRSAYRGTMRCTRVAELGVLTMDNLSRRLGDRQRYVTRAFTLNELFGD